jgi:hypothetical protein
MATAIQNEEAAIGLLAGKSEKERFHHMLWGRFMGRTKESKMKGETHVLPDSPIVWHRDFTTKGNDEMKIPMMRRLINKAKYGNDTLVGKAEHHRTNYQWLRIRERRHAVASLTYQDEQIVSMLQMVKTERPKLTRWYGEDTDYQCSIAFYEGYSDNVTSPTAGTSGLGVAKFHHPNFYGVKSGKIAWNANQTTYGQAIHTALNGYSGTATEIFSVRALYNLVEAAESHNIEMSAFPNSDTPFYALFVTPTQRKQLQQDTDFKELYRRIPDDIKKNPLFKGMFADAYIEGCLIFTRRFSVFGIQTNASGAITYGATNPKAAIDQFPLKGGMLLGKHAMAYGQARAMNFTRERLDHDHYGELGVRAIDGVARNDFPDKTPAAGTLTETINQSSILFATYSPHTWS